MYSYNLKQEWHAKCRHSSVSAEEQEQCGQYDLDDVEFDSR
jgi:hypothetical protein